MQNEIYLVAKQTVAGFHLDGILNPPYPLQCVPHLIIMAWAYHSFHIRLKLITIMENCYIIRLLNIF